MKQPEMLTSFSKTKLVVMKVIKGKDFFQQNPGNNNTYYKQKKNNKLEQLEKQ